MKDNNMMEQKTNLAKKAYTKPVLTKIRLAVEEAVLGTCKFGTGLGGKLACAPNDLTCSSTPRS